MSGDMILVVDFGGYQAQATARMLRGDQIYCEVVRPGKALARLADAPCRGILLAGEGGQTPRVDAELLERGIPVLALGSSARAVCGVLGGAVLEEAENAQTAMTTFSESPLFDSLMESERYYDAVNLLELPEGCKPIASCEGGFAPAFADEEKRIYALQFYPEINDPDGLVILSNFARNICACDPWWSLTAFAGETVQWLKNQIGDGTALMTVSGGVDSTVCAALVHRAIGDQLRCVYVNSGLLRQGEPEWVKEMFARMGIEISVIDASERFLTSLNGITDARQKRRAVKNELLETVADEAQKWGKADYLVQGTIYPDVLSARNSDNEAANDPRTLLHHIEFNCLLEPLRMLFKDEVRKLGEVLEVPGEMIYRQPFPEAGLAVRCIGEVTREKLDLLSRADAIFCEEIAAASLDKRIWSYFAVLTDMLSHGLRDGKHVVEHVLALRAVSSKDGSAAYYYRLPYDLLERVVERITTEVPGICRVLYDVTGKPPAMIEFE